MPHLEFHTYAGQLFWLAVTFVVLYFTLSRVVLPRISDVLETRGKIIADDLEKAETLKDEAETVSAKQEKLIRETGEKARKMIDESSAKAKAAVDKKRAELTSKLDEKLAKAEKEIAKIEKESVSVIETISADLSKKVADKLSKEAA